MRTTIPALMLLVVAFARPLSADELPAPDASRPEAVVHLFNGRDLSGFTTWLKESGHDDPRGVFRAENGVIHISGEDAGYLATKRAYKNYRFSVEYKWGRKTDGTGIVRNSGVLLHAVGPDGSADGVWKTAIEVQLAQGCEGDLIVIRGKDRHGKTIPATITCNVERGPDGRMRWKSDGQPTTYSGQQFWWTKHEVGFKERLDNRGKDDVASPLGQWTRVECICRGDRITVKINGHTVNQCYNAMPAAGQILLQNESNEIYFRNPTLRPLEPVSDKPDAHTSQSRRREEQH